MSLGLLIGLLLALPICLAILITIKFVVDNKDSIFNDMSVWTKKLNSRW